MMTMMINDLAKRCKEIRDNGADEEDQGKWEPVFYFTFTPKVLFVGLTLCYIIMVISDDTWEHSNSVVFCTFFVRCICILCL